MKEPVKANVDISMKTIRKVRDNVKRTTKITFKVNEGRRKLIETGSHKESGKF